MAGCQGEAVTEGLPRRARTSDPERVEGGETKPVANRETVPLGAGTAGTVRGRERGPRLEDAMGGEQRGPGSGPEAGRQTCGNGCLQKDISGPKYIHIISGL